MGNGDAPVLNKRRSFWGLIFRPSRQFRLTMGLLIAGVVASLVVMLYFLFRVVSMLASLGVQSPQLEEYVQGRLVGALSVLLLGNFAIWVLLLVLGALITHRIFGPIIPLVRHIEKLTKGDYSGRVQLRKGDELEEIAGALNALSEALEKGK